MPFQKKKRGRAKQYGQYTVEEYCRAMVDCKIFLRTFDGESAKSCFRQIAMFFMSTLRNISREERTKVTNHSAGFIKRHKAEIENYFKANYGETKYQSDGSIEYQNNKIFDLLGSEMDYMAFLIWKNIQGDFGLTNTFLNPIDPYLNILGLQVWQELSIKEKTAARKMVLTNIRKQAKEGKLSKKEAGEKIDALACEIYKAEQKELILQKDPLFNLELLEQVLTTQWEGLCNRKKYSYEAANASVTILKTQKTNTETNKNSEMITSESLREEAKQKRLLKKEALAKAEKTNCELWKAEQKELILQKDPLFNPELLEQVLCTQWDNFSGARKHRYKHGTEVRTNLKKTLNPEANKNSEVYTNESESEKAKKRCNPETNDNTEVSTNEPDKNYYEVTIIGGNEPIRSSTSTSQKINQIQKRKSQSTQEYIKKKQKLDLTSENNQEENNWKSKYFLIFDQNCKLVKSNDEHVQQIKMMEKQLDKLKKENEIYKGKLNKYEPVSVLIEDEFQVNNEVACNSNDHSYGSSNELQSTSNCGIPSTFSNEIPLAVVNKAQSTAEAQQCDEVSSKSIVTFYRVNYNVKDLRSYKDQHEPTVAENTEDLHVNNDDPSTSNCETPSTLKAQQCDSHDSIVTFDRVVLENNEETAQQNQTKTPSNQELKSEVDLLKQQMYEMQKFIFAKNKY